MAEANYHGKTSSAYWKPSGGAFGAIDNVTEWSITLTADVAESTVMAAATTGKGRESGFHAGTATVTCLLPGDLEIDEGALGALELLRDATDISLGYATAILGALCTGASVGVDMNGIETVTYSFQLSGTITNTVESGTP